jgi:hypothetical protein
VEACTSDWLVEGIERPFETKTKQKNSPFSLLFSLSHQLFKQKICDAASARWELVAVSITHRVGTVEVGEASVAIAASSAHRRDALEVKERERVFFVLFLAFRET